MTAVNADTNIIDLLAEPVTEPGVYDLPEFIYHADPVPGGSLSQSGAKKLLSTCPARFRYEQDNPPGPTRAMELGTAAHKLVLGVGADLVEVEAKDWRSKDAKEAADAARARGAVPLLSEEMRTVEAMAEALSQHPIARALLNRDAGTPEASLFWRDDETGVMLRSRFDFLPDRGVRDRLLVSDYKTCVSAHPDKFQKSAYDFGYFQQAAWYLSGVRALGLADDAAFVFIAQEKAPPYLVSVFDVDFVALDYGHSRNREAIDLFAECVAANHWPGYADDVVTLRLPRWAA